MQILGIYLTLASLGVSGRLRHLIMVSGDTCNLVRWQSDHEMLIGRLFSPRNLTFSLKIGTPLCLKAGKRLASLGNIILDSSRASEIPAQL